MTHQPTTREIKQMIDDEGIAVYDLTGGMRSILISRLTYDEAKTLLKADVTAEEWGDPLDDEQLLLCRDWYIDEWKQVIEEKNFGRSLRMLHIMVGIKCALGHSDWRSVPGGPDNEMAMGYGALDAYNHFALQISSGEWDKLTEEGKHERAINA